MLTKKQVRWAAQHDWYIGDVEHGAYRAVLVKDCHPSGEYFVNTFSDFEALKVWAGY